LIMYAAALAAEDAERKEAAEARNAADHAAHTVGSQLAEHGDKLEESEKAPIQEKLDAVKALLENEDAGTEELRTATTELLQSSQVIGQKMYESAQAEQAAAEASGDDGAAAGDDDVVEAEVVEDDDES
jgi:molecular chaperone DnaK